MAKFHVYMRRGGGELLLDCQADLLSGLNTRFVVPLLPEAEAPRPAARLNPIVIVRGERVMMATHFAAAIPVRALSEPIASLLSEQDAIGNALDMLISGF